MQKVLATALLMFAVAFPVHADIFKWRNASGEIEYGDTPPPGVEGSPVTVEADPASVQQPEPLEQQVQEMDAQIAEQKAAKAAAKKAKENEKLRKQNCESARKNIAELNRGGHRLTEMPDGEFERLSEEERQSLLRKNQNAEKAYCD